MWGQDCPGKTLAYNPTGSGAGVEQFIAKQVDFAGSDSRARRTSEVARPRSAAAATRRGTCRWCSARRHRLQRRGRRQAGRSTATCSPRSSTAQIKKWNDPAIAALNSGATLPDETSPPIFRSDSSGTTDNFQKYLDAAAHESWTKGAGKRVQGRRR